MKITYFSLFSYFRILRANFYIKTSHWHRSFKKSVLGMGTPNCISDCPPDTWNSKKHHRTTTRTSSYKKQHSLGSSKKNKNCCRSVVKRGNVQGCILKLYVRRNSQNCYFKGIRKLNQALEIMYSKLGYDGWNRATNGLPYPPMRCVSVMSYGWTKGGSALFARLQMRSSSEMAARQCDLC